MTPEQFRQKMLDIYDETLRDYNYNATRFGPAFRDLTRNPVTIALQFLYSSTLPPDIFTTFRKDGRLDLSMEYWMVGAAANLFEEDARTFAAWQLANGD